MGNAVHEGIDVGTQEDQQFRLGDFIRQGKVDFVIDIEFIALQVDAVKKGIFIEGVIRNNVPASCQGGRNHLVLMGIAAHQEENLSLEGITLSISVKTPEKGIFFKDFQQQISLKGFMNQTRKGGFSDTNNTFNGYIHKRSLRLFEISKTIPQRTYQSTKRAQR